MTDHKIKDGTREHTSIRDMQIFDDVLSKIKWKAPMLQVKVLPKQFGFGLALLNVNT